MNDAPHTHPASSRSLTLRELVDRLLARWLLILLITFGLVVAVGLWSFLVAPSYRSTGVLRIIDEQPRLALPEALSSLPGIDLMGGLGQDDFETEVGVIRSFRVAAAVADSLALTVRLEKPAGIRTSILDVLTVGDTDREARITLTPGADGAYDGVVKEPGEDEQALGRVRVGEPFGHLGYRLVLREPPEEEALETVRIRLAPRYEVIDELREDLDIRRQGTGSRLVEVSYVSTDRRGAANIVNRVVEEYVAYKNRTERSEASVTAAELRSQVALQLDSLVRAEERLRRYQEANRIIAPQEEAEAQVRRLAELQIAEDKMRIERRALADLVTVVRSRVQLGDDRPDGETGYRQLATFPSLIDNQAIQEILVIQLELENQRSDLLRQRTPENRDVRQLTERILEIDRQLFTLGVDYLEGLDNHLASIGSSLDALEAELGAMPRREMEYLRLFRDRTVLNEGYLLLQQQLRLAEIQDALKNDGVRVVDFALVAHEDDIEYPRPLVNVFLALMAGLALGVAVALVRDLLEA